MTPLFARKLSLLVPWFHASVGAPLSLLYVSTPPKREGLCSQTTCMEVSSVIIYYNKGAWPQIIIRVSSQISKHTYLQVPSGIFPLDNNRTNLSFEVFLTGVITYILNLIVRSQIAAKRLQLFPLLKYMITWPLLSTVNNYVIYILVTHKCIKNLYFTKKCQSPLIIRHILRSPTLSKHFFI